MGAAAKPQKTNDRRTKIGVILKMQDKNTLRLFLALRPLFVGKQLPYQFFLEEAALAQLKKTERAGLETASLHQMTKTCFMLIVIGGDGTLLRCTRELLHREAWKTCSLLGINSGRVGFLASLNAQEATKKMKTILQHPEKLGVEKRSCLRLAIQADGQKTKEYHVLNDVVLSKGSLSRIFEFEVSVDSEFLSVYRSDGLIVSPPTGSTAYNLAAGGAIIEPDIPAIQLTPISAQYFSNKPILISDRRSVFIRLLRHSTDIFITLDGHTGFRVKDEDLIQISKSAKQVNFLVPKENLQKHFFNSLRDKLKWGLYHSTDSSSATRL